MATPQDRINIGRQVDIMISRAKASGNAKNDLADLKSLFDGLSGRVQKEINNLPAPKQGTNGPSWYPRP